MAEQHIFYILGSIFFGLFAIIFLMVIGLISYVSSVISRIERISERVGRELLDSVRETKGYIRSISNYGSMSSLIGKAFRMHAKWRKQRSFDDED
jgi:hypothetical protein